MLTNPCHLQNSVRAVVYSKTDLDTPVVYTPRCRRNSLPTKQELYKIPKEVDELRRRCSKLWECSARRPFKYGMPGYIYEFRLKDPYATSNQKPINFRKIIEAIGAHESTYPSIEPLDRTINLGITKSVTKNQRNAENKTLGILSRLPAIILQRLPEALFNKMANIIYNFYFTPPAKLDENPLNQILFDKLTGFYRLFHFNYFESRFPSKVFTAEKMKEVIQKVEELAEEIKTSRKLHNTPFKVLDTLKTIDWSFLLGFSI